MSKHFINLADAESNLLAAATYLAENIGSSDGRAEAMKEIVAHYLAEKDVDFAAQLADSIDDTFVRDRLLCQVAEKCAALDDDEYAMQLADAIEDFGLQAVTREKIAAKKASKQEFEQAFEIADSLQHSSDLLAEIAVQQALSGHEQDALKTISRIDFHGSKVNALQAIAVHFQGLGENEKAIEMLSAASAEASEIEFTEEKIRSLTSIAAHYIEGGQQDRAIETLEQARIITEKLDNAHREGFLTLISLDFLRAGSIDLADRTLDLVTDKTHLASCLTSFAAEFDARGEQSEAVEALEEAYAILKSQKDREVRDSQSRFSVFGAIAVRFALLEKSERAIEIALENPVETERNSSLSQIAQICAVKNLDELSKIALNSIDDESAKLSALVSISDEKEKSGDRDEAIRFLNEAESFAESVPQYFVRSQVYGELAKRFFTYDLQEKARELSIENLQTISHISDESHKSIALAYLSDVYKTLGFNIEEKEKHLLQLMLRRAEW